MARSSRLRLSEVRAVYRLLGEVRELGDDPLCWRRHLTEQLARLVHARVGVAMERPRAITPGNEPGVVGLVDLGWDNDRERQFLFAYLRGEGLEAVPYWPAAQQLVTTTPCFTRSRRQLVADGAWYGSMHVNEFRRGSGVDDFIYSCQAPPGMPAAHFIGMHRAWGDKPFSPVEQRLVQLFHHELGRFWRATPEDEQLPLASMSPRQRQTLAFLVSGDSEKQVAVKLGVSQNTVHRYVVGVYRHFAVSSRGELLARWARYVSRGGFRPRLLLGE
jgi:DNA-binding CsgD family transcriptional regulator